MTTHHDVRVALLDESVPRPADLEAHLAGCAECRDFASAHRSLLRLEGTPGLPLRRRSIEQTQRRLAITAGLLLSVGGGVGLLALHGGHHEAARDWEAVETHPLAIENEADDRPASFEALSALTARAHEVIEHDPRDDAAMLRTFGALALWTAPTRTRPMRTLGNAAPPFTFTSEDTP